MIIKSLRKFTSQSCSKSIKVSELRKDINQYDKNIQNNLEKARNSCLVQNTTRISTVIDSCDQIKKKFYEDNFSLLEFPSIQELQYFLKQCDISSDSNDGEISRIYLEYFKQTQDSNLPIETLIEKMLQAPDFDQQCSVLLKTSFMRNCDIAKRYFVASIIEEYFQRRWPEFSLTPFGSTTNNFGSRTSDLDLNSDIVMDLKRVKRRLLALNEKMKIPIFTNLDFIDRARIPIVCWRFEPLRISGDITSAQPHGPTFSHLMYVVSQIEPQLPEFLRILKWWLTHLRIKMTSFQLQILLIFFWQRVHGLPSLGRIINLIYGNSYIDHYFDYSRSETNRQSLLYQFFDFYHDFKFDQSALCLASAEICPKRSQNPIEAWDPLDPDLNIARNIDPSTLNRLQLACQTCLDLIDERDMGINSVWGLPKLAGFFKSSRKGVLLSYGLNLKSKVKKKMKV